MLNALVEALIGLARLDEAAALVSGLLAVGRRFDTTVAWLGILPLLAEQRRVEQACRLAGHARHFWIESETKLDPVQEAAIGRAMAPAQALLSLEVALEAEGRVLTDDQAAALAVPKERR